VWRSVGILRNVHRNRTASCRALAPVRINQPRRCGAWKTIEPAAKLASGDQTGTGIGRDVHIVKQRWRSVLAKPCRPMAVESRREKRSRAGEQATSTFARIVCASCGVVMVWDMRLLLGTRRDTRLAMPIGP
jgi:hypothetical protein